MKQEAPDTELRLSDEESQSSDPQEVSTTQGTIAGYETKLVQYSKIIFILSVAAAAVAVGCITFLVLRSGEEQAYVDHFHQVTNEIVQVSQTRARQIFENIEGLSTFFTSYTLATNATMPFVIMPDFQVHASVSSQITGAATLTIHPLVTEENREQWESFSQSTYYEWMEESSNYDRTVNPKLYVDRRNTGTAADPSKESQRWNVTGIVPRIWKKVEGNVSGTPVSTAPQYFPEWQRSPSSDYNPFTNLDMASHPLFESSIEGMLETDHPVLTDVTDASFLVNKYDRRFPVEEQEEPHSYLLQPIYDDLEINSTAVGFLSAFLRWGTFFENVLPEYETGIMLVLYGTCGRQFSYILNGYSAEFLGNGDLHDMEYDNLKYDFEIAPFARLEEIPGEEKYCQYSARIYPSDIWKERFYTGDPFWYAAAVTGCFLVTTVAFVLYDVFVQRRQRKVLDTAERSGAIVSNLFPATVRDTLMKEAKQDRSMSTSIMMSGMDSGGPNTSENIYGSSPIAELFPASTIMFADIAGFTKWSAEREPKDVFTLLESIYYAFDTIAKRRRVFKVETIGDCYVAVCGVPTKNDLHAVVMSRFAAECLSKMRRLVVELEAILGPGTVDLALRVGLHSGPVTAGVLRGDKGRFQLFGDSMNTASRMESTGTKNRIQLSLTTAELLSAAGKDWTVPREEKVIAKGKGEMQTFWLVMPTRSDGDNTSTRYDDTSSAGESLSQVLNAPWPELE